MSFDAVVIGAGCAGLGAAAALREAGLNAVVLEAGGRVGGRAHTVAVGAAAFDRGASWLHAAERNPIAEIARRAGEGLVDSERHRARRSFVGDRLATPAERAEFEAGWERFSAVAAKAAAKGAAEGTDTSVAEAVGGLRDDPWMATVETWEAAQIAAADPRLLSVIDLQRNQLEGSNLEVPGGLGDLVRRRLAPLAGEIRLGTPASRVMWDHGGGVTVETPAGRIEAGACIVTVSTGVLASGAIGFDPPLPTAVRDAIAHLPMGLLTKVALRATDADRFGLPDYCGLARRVEERFAPNVSFLAWPMGRDHIVGFLGGHTAWRFAAEGHAALDDFVRAQLGRMIGADAVRRLDTGDITDWGTDPRFLGSYAYATPGHANARDILGQPLAAGRLVFAGEAVCTDGLAGTVGGAWNSGRAAAQTVASMSPRRASTSRLATLP